MRGVRIFFSVIVLLLVCGVQGTVLDYLISFKKNESGFGPVQFWEMDSGDFAAVHFGCRYVHISRDTGEIILERTDLGGLCQWVSGRRDGSFATKDYSQQGMTKATRELYGDEGIDDFVEGPVRQFDSTGQLIWTAPYVMHEDDDPQGIWTLSDGSVLSYDHYLVKFDPDGNLQWRLSIGVFGGVVEVEDLHVLVYGDGFPRHVVVTKLSPDGRILWKTRLEADCAAAKGLKPALSWGGSYYCGCTTNHMERFMYGSYFGYGGATEASDYRVSKLGKDGNILWTKTVVANGLDELRQVVPSDDDGVSLFGRTSSGHGGDKMAPGTGAWVVKLDAGGNIEGDYTLPPQYQSYLGKTRRGFVSGSSIGFAEVVAADSRIDTTILKPGDVISINSVLNRAYLSLPSAGVAGDLPRISATEDRIQLSTQWMVLSALEKDGYFSLRSLQNGLVANLKPDPSYSKNAPIIMVPDEPYDVDNVKASSLFRVKVLGVRSVNFETQGFGYLENQGHPRYEIYASTVRSNENMKFTIRRIHAG
uniref:Pyrrolo-quinoline quinone repeat domain-containing protein n=1 Tax=Rhodosorus marinus TaxID=101924 RepID=A0A7S3EEV2_9RHOD|mmetsp:Transcript_30877/g.118393  ORF Transcript_30877/g.118393 Transcript_30877/m.118393 type:complete len:533 (+) Transcript_30877:79-1677(+)